MKETWNKIIKQQQQNYVNKNDEVFFLLFLFLFSFFPFFVCYLLDYVGVCVFCGFYATKHKQNMRKNYAMNEINVYNLRNAVTFLIHFLKSKWYNN